VGTRRGIPIVVPSYNALARSPLPHVFILGAGFSKAINAVMPTLVELGNKIASELPKRGSFSSLPVTARDRLLRGLIPLGDLESWLSTLATPAPFVSEAEAHHNAAIFSEVARLIGDEIDASESKVFESVGDAPDWLQRLVRLWNGVGATLITFNYDTLVEHTATFIQPVGDRWPNAAFDLLKVHGSTSRWRARGDPSGQIFIEELLAGWGLTTVRHEHIGYERVIVPPVATKGSYYEPPWILQQWEEARRAIESAARLYIVGYRLPANDLAATSLIGQHLASAAEITLVNVNPKDPEAVLKQIGRPAQHVLCGPDCIKTELVADYEQVVGQALLPILAAMLTGLADGLPVMARVPDPSFNFLHVVTDTIQEVDRLILIADDSKFEWSQETIAIRLSRLRQEIENAAKNHSRVLIRCRAVDYPALSLGYAEQPVPWLAVAG
jgi:hypothetical protein